MTRSYPTRRKYAMKDELYQLTECTEAREEPFNKLSRKDWLDVFHCLNTREIEQIGLPENSNMKPRKRGLLLKGLQKGSNRYTLAMAINDYILEIFVPLSIEETISMRDRNFFPPQDDELYKKAVDLYWELRNNYRVVFKQIKKPPFIHDIVKEPS